MSIFATEPLTLDLDLTAIVRVKPPLALSMAIDELRDGEGGGSGLGRLASMAALCVVRWEGKDAPAAWPPMTYKGDDPDQAALATRYEWAVNLPSDVLTTVVTDTVAKATPTQDTKKKSKTPS